MLEVEVNHQIILLYYREHLGLRQIAKKLKIHRKTVTARIAEYERFKEMPLGDEGNSTVLLNQYLQTGTVYNGTTRTRRVLTDEIILFIDACLLENEAKKLDGRTKQRLKKIDIHEKLLTAGHHLSYSLVCQYIGFKLAKTQEAFIKQGYVAGESCEFDWGEVKLNLDGSYKRFFMAVFASSFSNYRYALLFQHQDTLAFMEAHINFFEHIGGVYLQMVYDNMRVAIAKFVGKTEKVPTEALLQLSNWYQYDWRFCNAARGNEKGHVERSVEFVRRKTFAFKDDFKSFQEAQDYLGQRVSELNKRALNTGTESPADKLQEEMNSLNSHPGRMECFSGDYQKVDKFATICMGTNRYSVPDHLTGCMVFVKIYSASIKIYEAAHVVCQHPRSYDRYKWIIDLNHYLTTLQHKPGAVAGSIALQQAPCWVKSLYTNHFSHDARSFIELLQYCQSHDISDQRLNDCVDKFSRQFPNSVSTEHIIALLGNQPEDNTLVMDNHLHDPIAARSIENMLELANMMKYN